MNHYVVYILFDRNRLVSDTILTRDFIPLSIYQCHYHGYINGVISMDIS